MERLLWTAPLLEALSDPNLPSGGPGRAPDGNYLINRFTLMITAPGDDTPQTTLKWVSAKTDFEQSGFHINGAIDENPETGWSIAPAVGRDHVAVFEIAPEFIIPPGSELTLIIDQNHTENQPLGKFRLSVASRLKTPLSVVEPERTDLLVARELLEKELSVPIPVAMAIEEGGMKGGLFPDFQDVPIHIRGTYTKLGPIVPRRMPQFLAGASQTPIAHGSGRRELADWVASNDNPLTARVIVNRVWQWHFGEGLVRTPSNFGKLGEAPTHPDLLDWLATKLIEDGWSLKKLHRRIMLSATYQQTSQTSKNSAQKDQL